MIKIHFALKNLYAVHHEKKNTKSYSILVLVITFSKE